MGGRILMERGRIRQIFVGKKVEFSQTLLVNSCGHFCPPLLSTRWVGQDLYWNPLVGIAMRHISISPTP